MSRGKLYEELGVAPDAPGEAVKKAFRRKAKALHPDKGGDPAQFRQALVAYEVLSDPGKRKRYDETGTYKTGPDNSASQAMNKLCQLIVQAVERNPYPERFDVVKHVRVQIKANIGRMEEHLAELKASAAKLRGAAKRFEAKGGKPNFAAAALEAKASETEALAETQVEQKAEAEEALKILEDLTYRSDPASYGSTSAGGWGPSAFDDILSRYGTGA